MIEVDILTVVSLCLASFSLGVSGTAIFYSFIIRKINDENK